MSEEKGSTELLEEVRQEFSVIAGVENFNRVAGKCRPILASRSRLLVEVEIQGEHVNTKGTMHGGQTASLVDIVTARALSLAVPDRPMASVELSLSYLNPVKLGDVVEVDARVLKTGRNLAFTEAELRRRSDGQVIAKGKHTLALLPAGSASTVGAAK